MRAGDQAARNELLRATCSRLERLAGKMLQGFPSVRRWAETGDVLQTSLMRLLRALETLRPASMRDFFNLAAVQIQRELLDLARHYASANRHEVPLDAAGDSVAHREAVSRDDLKDLERWQRFHEQWEKLPAEEREVVGLLYYHGWKQADVAALFNVTVRTVQRRWEAALAKLRDSLHDD
jgi:RNA polymerase sigma-70 factor (ECF subfamily)